ncbi:MAG TPA: CPBP family intramembrane glutamic endopeptidase [Solirubrobacteraceae bacterium]|nr:CPBP family intramembrane glutamic endopeptidase [Solirubrobacteraceae bacterium]
MGAPPPAQPPPGGARDPGASGSKQPPGEGPRAWPPWMAPAALVAALLLAALGGLIVDIPALALGAKISESHTPGGLVIADTAVQDAVFVAVAVFFAQLGGRKLSAWQFGLRPPRPKRTLRVLAVAVIAFIVFLLLWSAAVHTQREKLLETLGTRESTLLLVLSAALTCVMAPICEEFLFRGFIFTALRNWRGVLPAAVLTGLVFGGVHAGSAPAADLVPLAVLGFLLCLVYRYTGSLYPCIALHCTNNSIAFASLEEWSLPAGLALLLGALATIALLARIFIRVGVITPAPRAPTPERPYRPPTLEELSEGARGPQAR